MDESILSAVRDLKTATQIECVALEVDRSDRSGGRCTICETALVGHNAPVRTDSLHRFAAYQSEMLGGVYIYACPYALLHVASPVIRDDQTVALLVCGPSVLGVVDDEVVAAIRCSQAGSLLTEDGVSAWVRSLSRLAPNEAGALARTLRLVARALCDAHGAEILTGIGPETIRNDMAHFINYLTSMEGEKQSSMAYPIEAERELLQRVSAGDKSGAQRVLAIILQAVEGSPKTGVDEFRSRVLELVVLLSRAAIAGGANVEQVFGLEYRSLNRLRQITTRQEITAWLSRILVRFTELVFDLRHVRYSAHLSRVLEYVRENFREPITLRDAADAAGLSAGYLGRIFASEMHVGFTRYLQSVRLDEARRLLRHTTLPVGDVAGECGFTDHSYFAHVFRATTGASPSAFRQRRMK